MDDNKKKFADNILNRINESDDSFMSRLIETLADRSVLGGIINYAVFIFNIIGVIIYTVNSGLGLTQRLLYGLHFDSIAFKSFTFLEVSVLISYFVCFLAGGIVLFIVLKTGSSIAELCGLLYSHKFTRFILFIFMAVLSAGALILIISGNGLLTVKVCKWASPLFSVSGGLVVYSMSLRRVDIN